MSHLLYRLGRFAARRPWTVIGIWLAVTVVVVGSSVTFGRELEDTFDAPGLDSSEALALLTTAKSESAGLDSLVVLTPLDPQETFFDSPQAQAELAAVQARVMGLPNVLGSTDPAGVLIEDPELAVAQSLVSPDGRIALIRIQHPVVEELDAGDLTNLQEMAAEARDDSSLQVELSGGLFFMFAESETGTGEMLGLIAAVVILLLAFGSLIAMGLPVGMSLFGLALGVTSMSLVTYVIEIPSFAPQMASMVGLGVGIDYALFLVTRHREFLARGMTVEESVGRAVATAGQAVVFAGGTVVIAILGLSVAGVPFMTAAGVAISVTVLIMVIASITLLPAFLGLAGGWINRLAVGHLGRRRGQATGPAPVSRGWQRWGEHVSKHAWAYAIGVTAFLLALTAPVLWLRLGFPDDGSTSAEFQLTYGSLSNEEFVHLIYTNVMERTAEPGGFEYWLAKIRQGELTRGDVMFYFS